VYKNRIKYLFFISLLFSQNFAMTGNLEKIISYCKKNYGTVFFGVVLTAFLMETGLHRTYCIYTYDEWSGPMFSTFFAKNPSNATFIFCLDTSLITLGCGLLAVNYFSDGKFDFLNNNSNLIREGIKIVCADATPLLIATFTEFLGY